MRCALPAAFLVVTLLGATANAALQTRTLDAVEAEVTARDAALVGDLTKAEKKQKTAYKKALKFFAKESTSRKKDVALIKKIVKPLLKAHADDAVFVDLVNGGVDAFIGEIQGDLLHADRGVAELDLDNKHKKKCEKYRLKAQERVTGALGQLKFAKKLKFMGQAESHSRQTRKYLDKGLAIEEDLTPHQKAFLVQFKDGYEGTQNCVTCHADAGQQMLDSGHFQWSGTSENIVGHEDHDHGKVDLINNFCISIAANEARCTQCHTGYGWKDGNYDLTNVNAIDCLVCHDTTGTYKKDPKTAGLPNPAVDLTNVALNVGSPNRGNCGSCHYYAGGGNNVKHGDLAAEIGNTTRENDVHMGTDGVNYSCQTCHTTSEHDVAGMPLHSRDEGQVSCTDCHEGAIHGGGLMDTHTARIACQTCHIPTFSDMVPTKMRWEWGTAGQNIDPIPTDKYGMPTYNKMKGDFVWGKNVVPELRWFNGKWTRLILGEDDQYTELPVVLAGPVGDKDDPTAKLYPFKLMTGNQPADTVNQRMIAPHLFGMAGGPNPYWVKYDWNLALAEGAAAAGQVYSGTYGFVETEMYMTLNHEVAPKAQARTCNDCHNGGIDFLALGYDKDPLDM